MYYYAQADSNGKVHTVCQLSGMIIPIENSDERLRGTMYDPETNTFCGIRPILSMNKSEIKADGIDSATITVTFQNWDESPADYDKDLTLSIGGKTATAAKTDGKYSFIITGSEPGMKTVKVTNQDLMESAELSLTIIKPDEPDEGSSKKPVDKPLYRRLLFKN
ncbi:Ig-like domain-containing protein [Paenibacillus elgii]|uniref:Ig-like domain-containing protein n=1 Tax=Paenibacillus elgii TaxID=189691 RepID=UPI000FDA932F|nr:Ig-like domain-containing protein [Paenibacillus elgii]NEN84353.1 hypothetical protein [Paenibacillus elgii]